MTSSSLKTPTNYYDAKNFPYGFHRSGLLTRHQADLITQCGYKIRQLETLAIKPETEEEHAILSVISGERLPQTDIEKAWAKYLSLIGQQLSMTRISLAGARKTQLTSEDEWSA